VPEIGLGPSCQGGAQTAGCQGDGVGRRQRGPSKPEAAGTLVRVPISRRLLAEEEEVLVDLRPHWAFLAGPVVLTAVAVAVAVAVVVKFPSAPVGVAGVLAAMIAVPAIWLVGRLIRWLSISLVVTTTRIILRQGVFSRDLVQVRLHRVAEVHCRQTLIDRLIGSGRLVIEVMGDQPLAVDDVRRPRRLQRVINRQLEEVVHDGWFGAAYEGTASPEPAGLTHPDSSFLQDTPPHGVAMTSPLPAATWPGSLVPPPPYVPGQAPPLHAGGWPHEPDASAGYPTQSLAGTPSIPEQLIQLDDLRRRGIVSEDEFESKKAELLDRL
jgi:membrane protein YdbS with pleckstrin-like domain